MNTPTKSPPIVPLREVCTMKSSVPGFRARGELFQSPEPTERHDATFKVESVEQAMHLAEFGNGIFIRRRLYPVRVISACVDNPKDIYVYLQWAEQ